MSQDLQALVNQASANVTATPLSRRQVIPYADMQALNQPVDLNQLSNDLVSTLAVLAAQGPDAPKLLVASDKSALYSAATTNFSAKVTSAIALGGTTFTVDDPSWPAQAGWFWALQIPAHGNQIDGPLFAFTGTDPHQVVLSHGIGLALDVGDIVFSTPQIGLFGTGNLVDITDRSNRQLGQVSSTIARAFPGQVCPFSHRIDITANGTDQPVGIGIGGITLYVGQVSWFSGAIARLTLKDGSGGTVVGVMVNPSTTTTAFHDFNGRQLSLGNDLWVNAPNGIEIELTVSYDQR